MADVDYDPFGEHESRTDEPADEGTPLNQLGVTRAQVHAESGEKETSFNKLADLRARLEAEFEKGKVDELYKILSEEFPRNQDAIYCNNFVVEGGKLYYDGKYVPNYRST